MPRWAQSTNSVTVQQNRTLYLVSYTRLLDVVGKSILVLLQWPLFYACTFAFEDVSNPRPVVVRKISDHLPSSVTVQARFQVQWSFDVPVVTPLKPCGSTVTVHRGATLCTLSAFDTAQIVVLLTLTAFNISCSSSVMWNLRQDEASSVILNIYLEKCWDTTYFLYFIQSIYTLPCFNFAWPLFCCCAGELWLWVTDTNCLIPHQGAIILIPP